MSTITKSYGIFIDLNQGSIEEAGAKFQFYNDETYKKVVDKAKLLKPMYDVGIKHKDGTVTTESFAQFKNRYFLRPVE